MDATFMITTVVVGRLFIVARLEAFDAIRWRPCTEIKKKTRIRLFSCAILARVYTRERAEESTDKLVRVKVKTMSAQLVETGRFFLFFFLLISPISPSCFGFCLCLACCCGSLATCAATTFSLSSSFPRQ